jgi:hypothetical protein
MHCNVPQIRYIKIKCLIGSIPLNSCVLHLTLGKLSSEALQVMRRICSSHSPVLDWAYPALPSAKAPIRRAESNITQPVKRQIKLDRPGLLQCAFERVDLIFCGHRPVLILRAIALGPPLAYRSSVLSQGTLCSLLQICTFQTPPGAMHLHSHIFLQTSG